MNAEITLIREKRKNILLLFFSLLLIIVIAYLLVNSITNKILMTVNDMRNEYRPVVKKLNDSAGVAGSGVRELADSGKVIMEQFSDQIPKTVTTSLAGARDKYTASEKEVIHEYQMLKSLVGNDYQLFKTELNRFKSDIRTDVDWAKEELGQWRVLFTWVSLAFGLILTLMSIQDIMENTRWFISLIKESLQRKEDKLRTDSSSAS